VLVAEMYGAPHGIGRRIFAWGDTFQMPELFAGVLLIVAITIALNEALRVVEDIRRLRRRGFR
jgi:NitT/TauT family transport system permease protein